VDEGLEFKTRDARCWCGAISHLGLLCVAAFCGIRPHLINFEAMGTEMSLANNVIAGRDQLVADLAFRLWEEEGRPEGRAEDHWLRAAVLVDQEGANASPRKPAVKKLAPKKAAKK
jgi:hypothetical protein